MGCDIMLWSFLMSTLIRPFLDTDYDVRSSVLFVWLYKGHFMHVFIWCQVLVKANTPHG